MNKKFRSLLTDEDGATMVEYGIMVALIAAVCIGVVKTIGTSLNTQFGKVDAAIK